MEQATLSLARAGAPADGMLAVDIRRADIESALGSAGGGSVELLLDIARRGVDDDGPIDRHTLSVDCTSADLERMLEAESDTVRIGLDAEALARAIDEPDFEAHGLREKLAVLAVVVATTGAVVGTADARPTSVQGGGTGTAAVTDVRDMPADSMVASQQSGEHAGQMASPAIVQAAQSGQSGGAGSAARDMASDTLSAAAIASPSGAAGHDMASDTLSAATVSPSGAAGHDMASDTLAASESPTPVRDLPGDTIAASGVQPGLSVRDMPGDVVAASTASSATAAGATSDRGSIGSDGIDATQFVVVGAGALALLGAAFAAAGVSRHKPKPS